MSVTCAWHERDMSSDGNRTLGPFCGEATWTPGKYGGKHHEKTLSWVFKGIVVFGLLKTSCAFLGMCENKKSWNVSKQETSLPYTFQITNPLPFKWYLAPSRRYQAVLRQSLHGIPSCRWRGSSAASPKNGFADVGAAASPCGGCGRKIQAAEEAG